jgi:hypothetical protein
VEITNKLRFLRQKAGEMGSEPEIQFAPKMLSSAPKSSFDVFPKMNAKKTLSWTIIAKLMICTSGMV